MEYNFNMHFQMRSAVQEIEQIQKFEQQVDELAKKVWISRKGFNSAGFATAIGRAVLSVTDPEKIKIHEEFLATLPTEKKNEASL
jgi:hypothetical protein